MTLDEAIIHAKDKAKEQRKDNDTCVVKEGYGCKDCAYYYSKPCIECAGEHEQLAELLEELKEYKELEEQGLLKKFECAIGDTVYRIDRHNEIYECIVVGIKEVFNTTSYLLHASNDVDIRFHSWLNKCQIGYEFYLTKEEAEQELKRLGGSE